MNLQTEKKKKKQIKKCTTCNKKNPSTIPSVTNKNIYNAWILSFILRKNHSDLQYSEDIAEFLANFLTRIVKKTGQKLILGFNFINKNSDDFYVL